MLGTSHESKTQPMATKCWGDLQFTPEGQSKYNHLNTFYEYIRVIWLGTGLTVTLGFDEGSVLLITLNPKPQLGNMDS